MPAAASARILVVDDEKVVRDILTMALEMLGFRVLQAVNGEEGLDTFVRSKPDLVITDLMMPLINGAELVRRIKRQSPGIPVIVMSAEALISNADYMKFAASYGADASISKPFFVRDVTRIIQDLLNIQGEEGVDGVLVPAGGPDHEP